jgi:hypothetical protein
MLTTSMKGDVKLLDPFVKESNFTLHKQFSEDSGIAHLVVLGRLAYEGTRLVEDFEALIDPAPKSESDEAPLPAENPD